MVASVGICGIYFACDCRRSMLSTETMENAFWVRLQSSITLRSAERSCKNLLCVSTDATAPNLFRMFCCAPLAKDKVR